jgi:alkaline phosphatase
MKSIRLFVSWTFIIMTIVLFSCNRQTEQSQKPPSPGEKPPNPNQRTTGIIRQYKTGNVIFIHPDGSGASMWGAMRLLKVGPDGKTNWDNMDHIGLYRSHQTNSTNSSSHAGATVHAFGVKVPYNTYGIHPDRPIKSLSGKDYSILIEAQKAGMAVAIVNSGHICEPGTGVFVANSAQRKNTDTISEQIINSGVDIILSGGEELLLPEGETGYFGVPGKRKDGKNLIEVAKSNGYTIVYNRRELKALPVTTKKVLGVFAASHTFNDIPEEDLAKQGLPMFNPEAPTIAEMTKKALDILTFRRKQFLLVVEEEATDNFSNSNNAIGALTALERADDAIGVAMNYIKSNPKTLLITAADSDAGGMQVFNIRDLQAFDKPLPITQENGAPIDGPKGTGSLPFVAKPDKSGQELRFGICWASDADLAGAVIAKAHGLNAELLPNNVDNTDIYRIMYATLFGIELPNRDKPEIPNTKQ